MITAELETQRLLMDAVAFKKQLEQFLNNYNDLVYLMSQKFLAWNEVLEAMEKKMREAEIAAHYS